ncbi:MAG: efflux RND transporter periplasmic adaptor subunit [Xanthomonadaceae bacterium]|nr:efflux RND transporter periplasmic adaptor subunit [Xanthomonadaceae bacterium]
MHIPDRPFRFALALALLAAFGLAGCRGGDGPGEGGAAGEAAAASGRAGAERERPLPVEVAPVVQRRIAASYAGTANLEVPADAQVVAKTSGVLLRVLVEEGDRVRAGQVLAQLDPERPRLEAARAEATMRRAKNNFERSRELFGRQLVSAEAHDQLRFEYEAAKAAWELARLELSHTTITAPIGGVVAERMAKPGNLINLNTPLYRIVDTSRLEAVLNVPEREMATMVPGLPIRMVVDALRGQVFTGVVDRISPVVDAASGTFRVVGVFEGDQGLKPGMFGRLQIVYDEREAALTVPRAAVVEASGEASVFLVEDGKAVRRVVRLGHVNGSYAEIVEGLAEGDRVITAGRIAVRDGVAVEVLDPAPVEAPAEPVPAAAVAAG